MIRNITVQVKTDTLLIFLRLRHRINTIPDILISSTHLTLWISTQCYLHNKTIPSLRAHHSSPKTASVFLQRGHNCTANSFKQNCSTVRASKSINVGQLNFATRFIHVHIIGCKNQEKCFLLPFHFNVKRRGEMNEVKAEL